MLLAVQIRNELVTPFGSAGASGGAPGAEALANASDASANATRGGGGGGDDGGTAEEGDAVPYPPWRVVARDLV